MITLKLTPAQLRMINSALATYEAEDHDDVFGLAYRPDVMKRTRAAVWNAMEAAQVAP